MDGYQQRRHIWNAPLEIFGDGPVATAPPPPAESTRFNESGRKELTSDEVRFTTKGDSLYEFIMGWPQKSVLIKALANTSLLSPLKIRNVELLGYKDKVTGPRMNRASPS